MSNAKWEEIKNFIHVNDMADVVDYLHEKNGWPYHFSSIICNLYKDYLFLLAKYKKVIPPSYEIDQAHQAHILIEPENYQELSRTIFGNNYEQLSRYRPWYIDRNFISKKDSENFDNITKDLFQKEFHQDIHHYLNNGILAWFGDKIYGIFQHGINKTFFTIIIPFAIVMYAGSVIHHNELLSNTSEQLQIQAVQLAQQFENRQKICNYTAKDKENPNYLSQLYTFNEGLDKTLNQLIIAKRNAYQRHLITDKLFQELNKYVEKYANLLVAYQPYICSAPVEDPELAIQERKDIQEKIIQSEKELQLKFFGIKIKAAHISFTTEGPAFEY